MIGNDLGGHGSVEQGQKMYVLTTTSPEAFDEETRSRFVQLTMDESAAQTKAILERQRRSFTLEGVLERATAEAVQRLHHNAQRLLRPLAVVNPYVEQLTYKIPVGLELATISYDGVKRSIDVSNAPLEEILNLICGHWRYGLGAAERHDH